MKPLGGTYAVAFLSRLSPISPRGPVDLCFYSKATLSFVLLCFLKKKENLYLGLVFIIYGYFIISKSLEMESYSQKSLL